MGFGHVWAYMGAEEGFAVAVDVGGYPECSAEFGGMAEDCEAL
jgi:hypothetical protein